jgi:phage terminase large subunit GpA-like protein
MSHHQQLLELERELTLIAGGGQFANPRRLWADQLDALWPTEDISTHDVAVQYRVLPADGGTEEVPYREDLTPHLKGVHDAFDDPTKRIIAIKGPARAGKTIAAENFLLKVGMYGPPRNVLWYMHSEPDVRRYVDERVDFFLRHHGDLWHKRDRAKAPKWNLRRVDGGLWEWLAANDSTTRARSAALIIADEVDAMRPKIRDAWVTLAKNRQREYGNQAKMFIASHPDAGPLFGIDSILVDSDMRVRMGICPSCGHRIGAAREVAVERRMVWNMADLMKRGEDMPRDELLDFIAEQVRLVCPLCKGLITNDERLQMRFDAEWMGRGQSIAPDETIIGDLEPREIAGFVFHAVDAPFDSLGEIAKQWAGAKIEADETGSTANLKEVTVKTIGETFLEDDVASRPRIWKEVKARLVDTGYAMRTVPRGVDFLVAFVDVQGDRFEPGIIGFSRNIESWLIDRYSARQMEGFHDIRPGDRLGDWDVLEEVLRQTYPLNDGSGKHLGIAKLCVDTGGVPGVTDNARKWLANIQSRPVNPIAPWRISLQKGDAHTKGEFIGPYRKIEADAAGRPLPVAVGERTVNVTEVKKLIANRMEIEEPGPLRMHLPSDVTDAMVRELVAETYVNGLWISRGRNELWDIWVGAEVGRRLLAPENRQIDWENDRPVWATPFDPSQNGTSGGMAAAPQDFFSRLRDFNKRRGRPR